MKKKKQEIIIDGVTWTLNENNKYVNPDGKEVVKPRASAKGKAKGKTFATTKSKYKWFRKHHRKTARTI